MLDCVNEKKPCLSIFENVLGILRFMADLECQMKALTDYHIFWATLCPRMFGHAVRRPRVYFAAIRKDVSVVQDPQTLCAMGSHILKCQRKALVVGKFVEERKEAS